MFFGLKPKQNVVHAVLQEVIGVPTSVRLDPDLEALVMKTAEVLSVKKSALIRQAIQEFCRKTLERSGRRPYELVKDLIGCAEGGPRDLARNSRKFMVEMLHDRRARRPR